MSELKKQTTQQLLANGSTAARAELKRRGRDPETGKRSAGVDKVTLDEESFRAGFATGRSELQKNRYADASVGRRKYARVSKKYTQSWPEGFNAAVDLTNGAFATSVAKRAQALGLTINPSNRPKA